MESTEFDASIGGTEVLPHSANTFKFVSSRSVEIAAMTESILRPSKTKLIFQSLPVHMRRRVMSHNCKRLPRRLRKGHMEQLKKSGLPPKQKRPSRKYRRRPANLLEEYTRRQRRNMWLETHIWHAKRFHMKAKWGYRLAHRPCDKAFRACYRASSAHCLMQDISYYTTIHIKGTIDLIKDMFSSITNIACGLGISAKAYLSGNREGSVHIFKPNQYPFGYIGIINFIWTSSEDLWLFIHPAYAKEIESVLTDIKNGSNNLISETNENAKRRKLSNKFSKIQLEVITGLNRFRLTGPKSHAVLTHALKCVTDIEKVKHKEWIAETLKNNQLDLKEKHNYWSSIKSISSPSQLPTKIVLGLIVKDPRLSRPKKRTKAITVIEEINTDTLLNIPSFLSKSPIWNDRVREIINSNKVTNAQFIKHVTEKQLVPGEVNEDDPKLQPIPVILIQRPGSQEPEYKKIGYGNGWDIIIPPGYGLPFWLTFVMFGGRSGGLRETQNMAFEMGKTLFPPDTESGSQEEKIIEGELREKYFKRPPSKRVNYIKLAQPSPFICPWRILLNDWSDNKEDTFYVLRDKNIINNIEECIKKKKKLPQIENMNSCLVTIYIQLIGKGGLQNNAIICMPHLSDIKSKEIITEPHHEDSNARIRKEKRAEHRKILKQLRRKRVKCKKKAMNGIPLVKKVKTAITKQPSEYITAMRELWLPSNITTVRNTGIRETMGYVVHGAFSFTEAKSCGVGNVSYNALRNLLDNGMNQVLVRNTTSRVYRLCNIRLIKH